VQVSLAATRQHALDVLVRDDDGAVPRKGLVAAGVVAMEMRVDHVAHRLRRDRGYRRFELAVHLAVHVVDHDDAVVADDHRHVAADRAARAFEQIGAVAQIGGPDRSVLEIWRRRRRQARLGPRHAEKRDERRRGGQQSRAHRTSSPFSEFGGA
jgi:hypothetical protein